MNKMFLWARLGRIQAQDDDVAAAAAKVAAAFLRVMGIYIF